MLEGSDRTAAAERTLVRLLKENDESISRGSRNGEYQEKMRGQRGRLRAVAGICHVHESYF